MTQVRFHPAALAEFRAAARYYQDRQQGLGFRFIDAVENAIVRFKSNPQLYRVIKGGVRKCRVTRFPYGVLFRERGSDLFEIVAVMHLHRDPDYWKKRI